MQRREQLLLGGLLSAVVVWWGGGLLYSAVTSPFQTKSEQLSRLQKSVTEKEDQLLMLVRAKKSIAEAKAISLPPDAGGKIKDASNAQRFYQQWLTDIAELCEFEGTKVTPVRTFAKGNVYVSVVVKLEAKPRYGQLVRFLDQFYRTNLLHRITSLHITTKERELDPYLNVVLEAEGLALIDTPPRRTLFPQSELTEELSETSTELHVIQVDDFPKKPGFRIRIKNEFLKVTAIETMPVIEGETPIEIEKWTVERGIDKTSQAAHQLGTVVELVRLIPDQQERSIEELRELIAKNIFVKPTPPYKMKLAPFEKTFVKGKSNEFTIEAAGYDTSQGKPAFSIVEGALPGLKLEKNGKLTWRPGSDVKTDKYSIKIEVRHPSAPKGSLVETLNLRVRDNNTQKFANSKFPPVILNREWSFKPELSSTDSQSSKVTWKLGPRPPEGFKIDSRSGLMTWTPSDSVPIGEVTVPVIVTDSDTPPQSTTLSLKLDVRDDDASYTRLVFIFRDGDNKRACLFDPSKNKKIELREGDAFAVAELDGTVKQIGRKHIIIKLDRREVRLDVGQSLREAMVKSDELANRDYQ